jgi:hypothetical protein
VGDSDSSTRNTLGGAPAGASPQAEATSTSNVPIAAGARCRPAVGVRPDAFTGAETDARVATGPPHNPETKSQICCPPNSGQPCVLPS